MANVNLDWYFIQPEVRTFLAFSPISVRSPAGKAARSEVKAQALSVAL